MSEAVSANPWLTTASWRRLFRDRPIIPLTALLAVLVANAALTAFFFFL